MTALISSTPHQHNQGFQSEHISCDVHTRQHIFYCYSFTPRDDQLHCRVGIMIVIVIYASKLLHCINFADIEVFQRGQLSWSTEALHGWTTTIKRQKLGLVQSLVNAAQLLPIVKLCDHLSGCDGCGYGCYMIRVNYRNI